MSAPAEATEDFVDALEDTVNDAQEGLATKQDLDLLYQKVETLFAQQSAQHSREMLFWFIGVAALIGTAVAILTWVN